MEEINTEILLTTMFKYGFDRIDPILFTYTLGKVFSNDEGITLEFPMDEPISASFFAHVTKEGEVYKLKEPQENMERWYRLHSNDTLYNYLDTLDFKRIIQRKVEKLNIKNEESLINNPLFSQKEIDIIKTTNNKTQSSLDELIEKQKLRVEETNKMASSTEYIEWLIDFTKKNNDQIYDDDINNAENISEEDKKKARNLYILFDIISEYSDQYKCKDGYYCKIKYNDEVLNIGVLHGLTITHFVSLASKIDELGNPKIGYDIGATEYSEIIEKYKKYNKSKVYKKD